MTRIAVINLGLVGHVSPAVRLAGVLRRQGHDVTVWAPPAFEVAAEAVGVRFASHEAPLTKGERGAFAVRIAEATERSAEDVIERLHAEGVELVIHDMHAPWARVAADFLGLPRIMSNPIFPPIPDHPIAPAIGGGRGPATPSAEDAERLEASRVAIARRWGVELGDWWGTLISNAPVTISYTAAAVTGIDILPAGWRYVGPLMDPLPPRPASTTAPDEASGSTRPLVYVALGTYFNHRAEPFRAAVQALEHEPVDVIVSTGRGVIRPGDLRPLPANVTVRSFVDSRRLLERCAVHVTHGGCGSVHESLLAGVPMVCVPQGSDQAAWAASIAARGAGRTCVESPEALRDAVRRLLAEDSFRRCCRELGALLAAYDGGSEVAAAVEAALHQ